MTFAVAEGGSVKLVGVSETPAASEAEADASTLLLPESVAYAGTDYALATIAPYAFYLSGVTSVVLPASVTDVDERAFRSSDVSSVDVAEGSGSFASFDGALYDADLTSLLLIPGGRTGAVRVPDTATSVPASAFSHCAGVGSIAVDEGSPAFSSWDGLLYDADGTTLLRVPAGATDITIRDGCTTIAAGAMEGCASLATITAPASVASISPDVFTSVPTVGLPAAILAEDAPQLTALVALISTDDDLPEVDTSAITVTSSGDTTELWAQVGFSIESDASVASVETMASYQAVAVDVYNLNTINAYCNARISDRNYTLSQDTNHNLSIPLNGVRQLTFVVDALSSSVVSGGKADFVNLDPAHTSSGFSWISSIQSAGYTASASELFWIYYEADAKTVLSQARIPAPSAIFLYNPNYPAVDRTVTWNANGGTVSPTSSTVKAMTQPTSPRPVAPTGYYCTGWWSAASGGEKVCDAGANTGLIVRNRTFYAQYAPTSYTISYNLSGGSVSGNPTSYNIETASFTLKNPTRAGYKFTGWSGTGLSGSANTSVTVAKGSTGNRSYTANWSLYNCTYTPGDLVTSTTVRSGWRNTSTLADTDTGTETLTGAKMYGGTDLYGTGEATIALYQGDKGVDGRLYYSYFTPVPKAGYSVTGWWRGSTSSLVPDWQSYWFTSDAAFGPVVTANSYTVEYWNKAGTTKLSTDTGFKYDTARNLAAKPTTGVNAGYTAVGWATSPNQSTANYSFGSSQKNLVTSGTKKLYLAETANPITLTWDSNGGSAVASTTQTYSPTAKVALPANPTKAGYTFAGWWTAPTGGVQVTNSTALPTANATYYAHWSLNPYAIAYELNGGTVSGNPTTYDVTTTTFTLKNPIRTGYIFTGWSGTGLSGSANTSVTVAKGSTGDRSYAAHWLPAISADIPLEVTAQVDLLGIEEQQEASGYIESRCGEPLDVADVAFTPLSGATDLFGAANVADVALEVLAAGSTAPDARFALDASASQAPATPAAFRMASYGTRVPIAYRFAIPEDVLASIDPARFEQVTTPVCSVSYTVALA